MNKKIKILFLVLGIIVILFLACKIVETYALFYSEAEAMVSQNLGNWTIKVNDKDVSNGIVEQFTVEQLELETDENVKEGKIAPGLNGTFTITIDPTDTDVSVRYDITFDTSHLKAENMKLAKVEKVDSDNKLIEISENTYTGIISLSEIRQGKKDKIKVTLNWENIDENDLDDTELGKIKDNKINIPILVTITQYLGEEIITI